MWRRRKNVIGGAAQEGDFLILRGRQVVGRVLPAHFIPDASPYIWATYTYAAKHGRADSLVEASEAVRNYIRSHWPDSVASVPLAGDGSSR